MKKVLWLVIAAILVLAPVVATAAEPITNPDLEAACGIDVILVLDESGSIGTSGATQDVKNAYNAFIGALSGTGSDVAVIEFSSSATRVIEYTTVTADTITSTFGPYINTNYNPNGWTNWDDALSEVQRLNQDVKVAPLVVFITDGDPTAYNNQHSTTDPDNETQTVTTGASSTGVALTRAIDHANNVKTQGSKIMVIGVGAGLSSTASQNRLKAISGPDTYSGSPDVLNIATDDVILVTDFTNLATQLRQLVLELCENSLTVTKYVNNNNLPGWIEAPGWVITTYVQMDEIGQENNFEWVTPPACQVGTGCSATQPKTTAADGTALWQWEPGSVASPQPWSSQVTISETLQPKYWFDHGSCTIHALNGSTTSVPLVWGQTWGLTLASGEYATCEIYNARPTGVTMAGFNATATFPRLINVTWETLLETDMTGFNVYRSLSVDGEKTWIGYEEAKALGQPVGALYELPDSTVQSGVTYYYWLEIEGDPQDVPPASATGLYGVYIPCLVK